MLPVLLQIGSFRIKSLTVFLALAVFFAAFVFWRKAREEHYDLQLVGDVFLLSAVAWLLFSRVAFIVFHLYEFASQPLMMFNIAARPGMLPMAGALGAGYVLYRFAKNKKWDPFETLDFAVLAASIGLSIVAIGLFLDGTGFGSPTTMPWGVVFPQTVEKHHPVQLYTGVAYLALFVLLARVEYLYRTFEWYKAKRKSAQTGFLLSVFMIGYGVIQLLALAVSPPQYLAWGVRFDFLIALVIIISGIGLLYVRSGRALPGSST